MQLRKICQHPYLFESVEDKISPAGFVNDKLIRTSGKIELLSRVLPKFFATGHRVSIRDTLRIELLLSYVAISGSHLLSDDQSHGYHGGFSGVYGVEIPPFRWRDKDRRACKFCTALQCQGIGVYGLHFINESWGPRSQFADR